MGVKIFSVSNGCKNTLGAKLMKTNFRREMGVKTF